VGETWKSLRRYVPTATINTYELRATISRCVELPPERAWRLVLVVLFVVFVVLAYQGVFTPARPHRDVARLAGELAGAQDALAKARTQHAAELKAWEEKRAAYEKASAKRLAGVQAALGTAQAIWRGGRRSTPRPPRRLPA
jgi:hypothetical protein